MPSIITGAPSALQNAAGNAAGIFDVLRQREDAQRKEAEQLGLAKRRLDQTDRSLDMRQTQFDYGRERDSVADDRYNTEVSQDQALTDQIAKYAEETFGVDLQGMDSAGALRAVDLLEYQQQLRTASETTKGIQQMLMEQLGLGQQEPLAPGVQTEEGIAAQQEQQEIDPQLEQLFLMAENANTMQDHARVQEAMGGIVVKAKQAQKDAQDRMAIAASGFSQIQEMEARGLDSRLSGALNWTLELYRNGHIEYEEFRDMKTRVEDAQIAAKKQQVDILARGVNSSYDKSQAEYRTKMNKENMGMVGGLKSLDDSGGGGGDSGGLQNLSHEEARQEMLKVFGDEYEVAKQAVAGGKKPEDVAMGYMRAGSISKQTAATLAFALTDTPE